MYKTCDVHTLQILDSTLILFNKRQPDQKTNNDFVSLSVTVPYPIWRYRRISDLCSLHEINSSFISFRIVRTETRGKGAVNEGWQTVNSRPSVQIKMVQFNKHFPFKDVFSHTKKERKPKFLFSCLVTPPFLTVRPRKWILESLWSKV